MKSEKQKKKITALEQELANLKSHTPEKCKTGKHILYSWVTGGRNGHVITRCQICDYKREGWD